MFSYLFIISVIFDLTADKNNKETEYDTKYFIELNYQT